ncbi:hypothetical protein L6164_009095 [Bauhinia variegata]|uniref:Uncharacterized protein n=1 Tax=Bauhinia variegata TaxID=167791 RepID=A0ACB9PIN8_BAUVA|nr:hypothetical protein L6164_009095 [Bauhinia variegata]
MLIPCDFCDSKTAVLYCKADSAKLCLLCDQHVHKANALSLKHVRFQICDNCKNDTATIQCPTDSLILCQVCDWDVHNNSSTSSLHERTQVEGFSGCPSIIELATVFGFDWKPKDLNAMDLGSRQNELKLKYFQGYMVPDFHSSVSSALPKDQNLKCGNYRDDAYEQLLEMARRNLAQIDKERAELDPGTPPGRLAHQVDVESLELNNGDDHELLQQQTLFTSLLMLPTDGDSRNTDYASEGDLLWDSSNPSYQMAQVWDFQSGKPRDCGEPKLSMFDSLEESSLMIPRTFQDIDNMNCMTFGDDLLSRNNQSDQSSSSHVMMKEESYKKPRDGLSSGSNLIESMIYNGTVMEHFVGGSEDANMVRPKVSADELAKNRGDAMLRYMEKKKTRRYDKHIRYESRKARADLRKRVRGRFVKASDATDAQV